MAWEDYQAPKIAGQKPTEGNRAENGGQHVQEQASYGTNIVGIAQISGDGVAECLVPCEDTDEGSPMDSMN